MGSSVRNFFKSRPEVAEFLSPLRVGPPVGLHMDRYKAGIDNLHVDVMLGEKSSAAILSLVRKMVQEDLAKQGYCDAGKAPAKEDFDAFHNAYCGLMEGVLQRQRKRNAEIADDLKLLQLSLLRVMLEAPGRVIGQLREQLKTELDLAGGRALELHDRLVAVARHAPGVRYRTLRRLFKQIQRIESKELRKIRKSVLGHSWVIPKQLLFNPLLHLPDLSIEAHFVNHYPLVCMDWEEGGMFVQTNRIVCETFKEYLPEWSQPVDSASQAAFEKSGGEGFQIREREWRGGFAEFLDGHRLLDQALQAEEFKVYRTSWLDMPINIDVLFYRPATSRWFKGNEGAGCGINGWSSPTIITFQQRAINDLLKQLQKTGILQRAIVSYRVPRLYRQLKERVAARDIYDYLNGTQSRRQLLKRLSSIPAAETDEIMRALDVVYNYIRRMPSGKQLEYAQRYLKDFLSFRRDLKLAYHTHRQMSYLRLLERREDVQLSRDNGTLYEFHVRSDPSATEQRISSHVVLKADLRGSTEITHQLMAKRLNPATHFSLNFFGPINNLLARFGAQKVFVEGDALILTVLEHDGAGSHAMSVANACGLACKIHQVMETQNRQNLLHNLPKLELGLGIAFCNDAPAYLYDDQRKIMISPAINQADRLSSCAAELRRNSAWKRSRRHSIEVMHAGGDPGVAGKLLRYNVNGINLDAPAFEKLRRELALHKVQLVSRSGTRHLYHAGRFIDRQGSPHWLVVREAPIKTLHGDQAVLEAGAQAEYFYEVVTDSSLIGRVKSKLKTRQELLKQQA